MKGLPPFSAETHVRVTVPGLVGLDLVQPPFPVGDGCDEVVRAAVPEATVYEHGDAKAGEGHIDPTPGQARNGVLHPKPSPATM